MPDLADRYRRLLRWYPRDYRRERGQELVGMLLDLAPPGRRRPSLREAVNLFRNGMRCRLGRPASHAVVAWAVATAVVCGLFSAAWASRAAWETARPLSSTQETLAILAEVLPGYDFSEDTYRDKAMFVVYSQPFGVDSIGAMLAGDGGEYELGNTRAGIIGHSVADTARLAAEARQRLRESGWKTYEPRLSNLYDCAGPPCDPTNIPQQITLAAQRGDNMLELEFSPKDSLNEARVHAEVSRATPKAVYPASVLGGLAGALAGWLVFGWASRRLERGSALRSAMAIGLYGPAMFFWWLPILAIMPFALVYHLNNPQPRWAPLWQWLGQPVASALYLLGCVLALTAVAVAAVPLRHADTTEQVPA